MKTFLIIAAVVVVAVSIVIAAAVLAVAQTSEAMKEFMD